jgi:hypothetical protein
VLIIR